MIKKNNKLTIEGNFFNLIKDIYKNPSINNRGERLKSLGNGKCFCQIHREFQGAPNSQNNDAKSKGQDTSCHM